MPAGRRSTTSVQPLRSRCAVAAAERLPAGHITSSGRSFGSSAWRAANDDIGQQDGALDARRRELVGSRTSTISGRVAGRRRSRSRAAAASRTSIVGTPSGLHHRVLLGSGGGSSVRVGRDRPVEARPAARRSRPAARRRPVADDAAGGRPTRPTPGARGRREVLGHPQRVAADGVDVRRGELDQALVEVALGRVGGAHPGRLQQLVGLEEVAPRRRPRGRRRRPRGGRLRGQRPIGLGRPPWRTVARRRSSATRSGQVGQRLPPGEARRQLVPPLDRRPRRAASRARSGGRWRAPGSRSARSRSRGG